MIRNHLIRIEKTLLFFIILLNVSYPQPANVTAQTEEYIFQRSWGGEADQIRYPHAVGVGPTGDIYTVNNGRMTIIDQQTRTYRVWDNFYQSITLGVDYPMNITFDNDGYILFPDTFNDRILKFDSSGILQASWGKTGSGPGEFRDPYGVVIDESGNIYITDLGNSRVQKFSNEGVFVQEWGISNSEFTPYSIAIGNQNEIYIVDLAINCIQIFTRNGEFIKSFGEEILVNPQGIAIDNINQVYVVDNYLNTIEVFSSDGIFLRTIGTRHESGSEPGQFKWPEGIAIDGSNNLYLSDTYNHRIQKINSEGDYIISWGTTISALGNFTTPSGMKVDDDGNLLVVDVGNNRIQKFSPNGSFISAWGSEGTMGGQFGNPRDVTVDETGDIYVADHDNGRIQKFTSRGEFISAWNGLLFPSGIEINPVLDKVYVVDSGNNRVVVFNYDGELITSWGIEGIENGHFRNPQGIAISESGDVFIVDHWNHRIQKFNSDGIFLAGWGEYGFDPGYLYWPIDIAVDNTNTVYVADTHNNRIQVFDQNGVFIASWGNFGMGDGQFRQPNGITTDEFGNIFVADSGNNRIQVFNTALPNRDPISGLIQNGTFDSRLNHWAIGGELSVSSVDYHTDQAMLLGEPVPRLEQGLSQAWGHQTIFVDPSWYRPTLTFQYNMNVNDIMDYSDFFVAIQDGVGLNHFTTVLRDGFRPSTPGVPPSPGTNLGWRTGTYDLSAYKGQHIRIVFSNRNLWPNSWGIWTYVDDVRVIDAGPLPDNPISIYLPALTRGRYDPVPTQKTTQGIIRPAIEP